MHITIQPQGEWFWPVHLFLIGYPFWNFRIILEKILANNYLCETVSELDTSVIRILKCCLTCHFTWKKCLTWYLKSTYMELIESMARNWSRVKQKLYTDISPYPRRCAWNRKNCILMISYKISYIYCTRMYPMALMWLSPLPKERTASLPCAECKLIVLYQSSRLLFIRCVIQKSVVISISSLRSQEWLKLDSR